MTYSLYEARVLSRKTQQEVANHVGVSIPTWRAYEKKEKQKKLSADKLISFCELVGIEPNQIDLNKK